MAPRKKSVKKVEAKETILEPVEEQKVPEPVETAPAPAPEPVKPKKIEKTHKFNVGDIVFVNRNASVDLNGFKLFPQYKKYTYTVEAYDEKSGVYTLRRLNLSLKLKEDLILAPNERAHDPINRRQF